MTLNKGKIEQKLWKIFEILRGTLNPDEILYIISRILIIKKLSNEYEKKETRFIILSEARWKSLVLSTNDKKSEILNVLDLIENKNPFFKDVLLTPSFKTYFKRIENNILEEILEVFNDSDFILNNDNLEYPLIIKDVFRELIDLVASKTAAKGGVYYTPNDLTRLMVHFLEPQEHMTICDPACGSGGFLIETFKYLDSNKKNASNSEYFGQEISLETYALAKINLFLNNIKNFTLKLGDTIRDPQLLDNDKKLLKYDLVFADPPWMMGNWGRKQLINEDIYERLKYGTPPSYSADWMWIQHIIATLNDNGCAAVLLNKGALFRYNEKSIREGIIKDDLIEAIIELPPNMFYKSSLSACILILNKNKADSLKKKIYFLKIESDKKKKEYKNTLSYENLKGILLSYKKKEVKNFISALVGYQEIEYNEFTLNPGLYINDISKIAEKRGLIYFKMEDIVVEINQLRTGDKEEFEPMLNCFYLPLKGIYPACNSPEDFTMKPQNYYQIILKQESAYSEYACGFFNTDLGHMTREQMSMGTTITRIFKRDLLKLKIYLPKIDIQKKVIEVMSKIQEFSVQLEEFKKEMWSYPASVTNIKKEILKYNRKESFEDWIDTLPFPIASILWRYHSDLEPVKKLEHLLNFFEATAVFFGTLMLSALNSDENLLIEHKGKVFTDQQGNFVKLDKSYFGQWVIIDKRLANIFRRILNEDFDKCKALFKINSREILNLIFNKNIYNILEKCTLYRNKWKGHTPIISHSLTKERLVSIQKELTSFRRIISDKFVEVILIIPESDLKTIDGILHHNVKILIGSRMIYKRDRIPVIQQLNINSIYLIQKNNLISLELIPFFQIFLIPKEEKIACYFYDTIEGDKVHWNSYHFKDPSEKSESNERLVAFIKNLEKE